MDEAAIIKYITDTFPGVDLVSSSGDTYFFYNPDNGLPPDHRFPFVTLVTDDKHDQASNLSRPSVFRLNIGVKKETYQSMFGTPPSFPKDGGIVDTGHDFTALDQIMPHPVYAAMNWVCVLNPGDATWEAVRSLLAEAYEMAVSKYDKRAAHREGA
jgi:hypothetical protein